MAVDEIAGAVGWKRDASTSSATGEEIKEILQQAQQPEKGRIENKKTVNLVLKTLGSRFFISNFW